MVWFILLVLWPLAELFVIVEVAEWIGFVWMLVALLASWPVGAWVLRHQGRAAWRRLTVTVSRGRTPAREVADGALILGGGLLLLIPGFITDALGLLLLLTPIRVLTRRGVIRYGRSGPLRWLIGFGDHDHGRRGHRRAGFRSRRPDPGRDYDVESTAEDIDRPKPRGDRPR